MKSPGVLLLLCASMIICICEGSINLCVLKLLLFLLSVAFSNAQLALSISASSVPPFTVGSVLSLSCQLAGTLNNISVSYQWMRNCPPLNQCFGGSMTQNISTLSRDTVPVLTSVDSGTYTCIAMHGNVTFQDSFIVTVTGKLKCKGGQLKTQVQGGAQSGVL